MIDACPYILLIDDRTAALYVFRLDYRTGTIIEVGETSPHSSRHRSMLPFPYLVLFHQKRKVK